MRLVENHMEKCHKVLHVTDLKAVPQVDAAYRLLASQMKAWGYKKDITQIPTQPIPYVPTSVSKKFEQSSSKMMSHHPGRCRPMTSKRWCTVIAQSLVSWPSQKWMHLGNSWRRPCFAIHTALSLLMEQFSHFKKNSECQNGEIYIYILILICIYT
jgi:hypothetical protein